MYLWELGIVFHEHKFLVQFVANEAFKFPTVPHKAWQGGESDGSEAEEVAEPVREG